MYERSRYGRVRVLVRVIAVAALVAGGQAVAPTAAHAIPGSITFPLNTTKSVIESQSPKWCSTWQVNCHHDYNAADIFAPTGTPVVSPVAGTVTSATTASSGVGSRVQIRDDHGDLWYLAHMHHSPGLQVSLNQRVNPGTAIGFVGTSAHTGGSQPHLHIDMLPGYTSRPSCSDAACSIYPFYDPQPLLVAAYNRLASQVFEAASDRGWANMPVSGASGVVMGSAVAALKYNGIKLVYTVNNGAIYEASSVAGWQNPFTGITGVGGSPLSVINVNGTKFIYSVINGAVYEASSANSWNNLFTGITGVSNSAISAIEYNGIKLVYTIVNGAVYGASSVGGWNNLFTGITGVSDSALAVVNVNGTILIYTVVNGAVYEASSANDYRNVFTGITGVSNSALAVVNVNGTKLIYTVVNGAVHEASSANAWRNLSTAVPAPAGTTISAIEVNGVKNFYTR